MTIVVSQSTAGAGTSLTGSVPNPTPGTGAVLWGGVAGFGSATRNASGGVNLPGSNSWDTTTAEHFIELNTASSTANTADPTINIRMTVGSNSPDLSFFETAAGRNGYVAYFDLRNGYIRVMKMTGTTAVQLGSDVALTGTLVNRVNFQKCKFTRGTAGALVATFTDGAGVTATSTQTDTSHTGTIVNAVVFDGGGSSVTNWKVANIQIDANIVAPNAPTLGTPNTITDTSVTIPVTDLSTNETGFRFELSTQGASGPWVSYTPDFGANATGSFNATLSGLSGSTIYHCRAFAKGAAESAASNTVTFTTAISSTGGGGTLDVLAGASTVTGVTISPTTATVAAGATTSFVATVQGANSPSQAVTWSAPAGGSVNASGVFTAPNAIGSSFKMRATSVQDAGFFAEATITVTDAIAPTGSLVVTPNPLTVSGDLTLTATVADNVAIQSVAFFEGVSPTGTLLFTDSAPPYSHVVARTSANNGTNNFYVEVRDTSNNLATFSASAVVNIVAVGNVLATSALRISEWSGGDRIERVRLTNGGVPIVGATINCASSDPSNVSTSPAVATDSNGYAAFLLSFNSGGRSLMTFTHAASGTVGYLLAISRTLTD